MSSASSPIAANLAIYFTFKDATGPVLPLCAIAFTYGLVATTGIILNLSLCYVTYREKSFRCSTNYFIAITALFEATHQFFGHYFFVVIAFSGVNFVAYGTAFAVQWIAAFGVAAAQMTMLTTAFDRFICVFFPMSYRALNSHLYLTANTLLACVCGGLAVAYGYYFYREHATMMVTGWLGDTISLDYVIVFCAGIFILSIISIVFYLAIWVRIRFVRLSEQQQMLSHVDQRVFKSLFWIISVVLGGYMTSSLAFIITQTFFAEYAGVDWYVAVVAGLTLNISAASSAPIIFAFSSEYRKAYRKHLTGPLARSCCRMVSWLKNGGRAVDINPAVYSSNVGGSHVVVTLGRASKNTHQ